MAGLKVGDSVICINNFMCNLEVGNSYIISKIFTCNEYDYLKLYGDDNEYLIYRFREDIRGCRINKLKEINEKYI